MLLQDLLVATVLLEQMDNYFAKQEKNIYFSFITKGSIRTLHSFFSLHWKFGVVAGMSTLHF
jgi:hypothetical protein